VQKSQVKIQKVSKRMKHTDSLLSAGVRTEK
jgi:hypothetical protein